MNILYDARLLAAPNQTGVGHFTLQLIKHLTRSDRSCTFLVFFNSFHSDYQQHFQTLMAEHLPAAQDNWRLLVSRYPNKFLSTTWRYLSWPRVHADFARADLIHSPHINTFPKLKAPRIVTIHDLSYLRFPGFCSRRSRLWHRFMSGQAKKADFFIANSHATKEDITKIWRIDSSRIRVIYPGSSPLAEITPRTWKDVQLKFGIKSDFLLYLGTLEPRKNLPNLLQAFQLLTADRNYQGLQLVLAGQPAFRCLELMAQIRALDLADKVIITGYLEADEKSALYQHARIFVYPSLYEGFGFPLLEAMQAGIPVISSNISSIPEVTADAALLVDPYEPAQLQEAMRRLLDDTALSQKLAERGRSQCSHFSWAETAHQTLDYYRNILG